MIERFIAIAAEELAMAQWTLFDVATVMVDGALGHIAVVAVSSDGGEISRESPTHLRAIGNRLADATQDKDWVRATADPLQHFSLTQ